MTNPFILKVHTEKERVTLCTVFTVYHHAALFRYSLPFVGPPVIILWLLQIKPFSTKVCYSCSYAPPPHLHSPREWERNFECFFTRPAD